MRIIMKLVSSCDLFQVAEAWSISRGKLYPQLSCSMVLLN